MSFEKSTKISGYLEKRGKLSIMGRWKKWWCVLEGQLLLYYKSRIEYTNLSPCCGSLNMALVKNVQPHVGFQIHIMTHSQLILLRTKNKEKQQQWFHALVGVLPQNSHLSPLLCFSTSSIEYRRKSQRKKKPKHTDKKVFEESIKIADLDESSLYSNSDNDILNPTNESRLSIFEKHSLTEIQNISTSQERIQFDTSKISTSLECNLQQQNTCVRNSLKCSSEVHIRRYSSYHSVINGVFINERIPNRRSISCECVFTHYRTSSIENFVDSCSIRRLGGSQPIDQHFDDTDECKKYKRRNRKKRRNDSKKYNTLSKKSLSFLRKIFKRKMENKNQGSVENNSSQEAVEENLRNILPALENVEVNISESSELDIKEPNTIQTIKNDETAQIKIEEITPCNDFDEKFIANTNSNNETESESSDAESGIVAIGNCQEEELPDLPIKNDDKDSISIDNRASIELDSLFLQLTTLNTQRDKSHESLEFHNNIIIEDPDYDIPRPHTSLISDTGNISSTQEKNCSDFLRNSDNITNHRCDSLLLDMAPDSLEMPWLLNDTKCNINYWTTKKEFDLCSENDSGSEYDYHDSLNSNKILDDC